MQPYELKPFEKDLVEDKPGSEKSLVDQEFITTLEETIKTQQETIDNLKEQTNIE